MLRDHRHARALRAFALFVAGTPFVAACLHEIPPAPAPSEPRASVPKGPPKSPVAEPGGPKESAHELFLASLTCFGAPVYMDAFGVEPRDAARTIERACAPLERAASETGVNVEDDEAYVRAVRVSIERRATDLAPAERADLLRLFDVSMTAVREARSPWGRGPWGDLVELLDTLGTPSLRHEGEALAGLLEADRLLRAEHRGGVAAPAIVELESRLVERSNRLSPCDLRTAIDGVVQRLRTMS